MSSGTLACPRCGTALVAVREPQGLVFECAECAGHAEGVTVLRKRLEADAVNDLWQRALSVRARKGVPCPSCRWPMAEVAVQSEEREAVVDACDRCLFVWFDAKERQALPVQVAEEARLSPEAAEAVVWFESQSDVGASSGERRAGGSAPLPAWTSAPMDADDEVRPWLTWSLAAGLALFPIVAAFTGDASLPTEVPRRARWLFRAVAEWGFAPDDPWRHGGLTFLSSAFVATSRLSLLLGVVFLLAIGRRVEARAGPAALGGLYVLGSIAGCLVHWLSQSGRHVVLAGSAGAITAIYAWCLVVYPPVDERPPEIPSRDPAARGARRWRRHRVAWRLDVPWLLAAWALVHWLDVQTTWVDWATPGGFWGGAIAGAACGLVARRIRGAHGTT